eukprot:scaffold133273_cov71-Phaeocystis_antarctica.AAC.7
MRTSSAQSKSAAAAAGTPAGATASKSASRSCFGSPPSGLRRCACMPRVYRLKVAPYSPGSEACPRR